MRKLNDFKHLVILIVFFRRNPNVDLKNRIRILFQLLVGKEFISFNYSSIRTFILNDSVPAVVYYVNDSLEKINKQVESIQHAPIVFDIGANNGIFSLLIKNKFPDAVIHIFEPSPLLNQSIKRNMVSYDGIHIHTVALSNENSIQKFFINNRSQQTNASSKESAVKGTYSKLRDKTIEIDVETTTLDSFMSKLEIKSISVLKVDIQGAEYDMILGGLNSILRTDQALFEISFLDDNVFLAIEKLRQNFSKYEVINEVKFGADIKFYRQ